MTSSLRPPRTASSTNRAPTKPPAPRIATPPAIAAPSSAARRSAPVPRRRRARLPRRANDVEAGHQRLVPRQLHDAGGPRVRELDPAVRLDAVRLAVVGVAGHGRPAEQRPQEIQHMRAEVDEDATARGPAAERRIAADGPAVDLALAV